MSHGQYYIKKNGRYVKANDLTAWEGLGEGSWLVTIRPGSKSAKNFIDPKFSELDAALYYLHEGLVNAMHEASKLRPSSKKMSKKERKAWDVYEKTMGKDMPVYFEYASLSEIADKGCDYLKKVIYDNKYDPDKLSKKFESKHYRDHVNKIKKENEGKKRINSIMDLEV